MAGETLTLTPLSGAIKAVLGNYGPTYYPALERSSDGSAFVSLGTGTTSGTTDATAQPEVSYWYRAKVGTSPDTYSAVAGPASTLTLITPSAVSAGRVGADVVLTMTTSSTMTTGWTVEQATLTGGTWGAWTTVIPSTTTATTARIANVTTTTSTKYRVNGTGAGGRTSAASPESNVVSALSAPSAPTNLAPVGTVAFSEATAHTWQHNPTDTTAQTAYEVQYQTSTNNGTTWSALTSTGKVVSAVSSWARTWPSACLARWQVRTYGQSAAASAWSAMSTLTVAARPVASTSLGSTYASSLLVVPVGYACSGGSQMVGARVVLKQAGTVLEDKSVAGVVSSVTMGTPVADATTYTVDVWVTSATGLTSAVASASTTVSYVRPPTPTFVATHADGRVTLTITNPAGTAPAVSNQIERNGVLLSATTGANSSWVDKIPPLETDVVYRVLAVSAIPTSAWSAPVSVSTRDATPRAWLNGGPGMATAIALPYNVNLAVKPTPDQSLTLYEARRDPVLTMGPHDDWSANLTAVVTTMAEVNAAITLFEQGVCCYRDPDGHRVFVAASGPDYNSGAGRATYRPLTISMRRVSHDE